MDRAADAGGFLLAEGTSLEPLPRVVEQFGALGAEFASAAVMATAVDADHRADRPQFALEPFAEHRRIVAHGAAKATRGPAPPFPSPATRTAVGQIAYRAAPFASCLFFATEAEEATAQSGILQI